MKANSFLKLEWMGYETRRKFMLFLWGLAIATLIGVPHTKQDGSLGYIFNVYASKWDGWLTWGRVVALLLLWFGYYVLLKRKN